MPSSSKETRPFRLGAVTVNGESTGSFTRSYGGSRPSIPAMCSLAVVNVRHLMWASAVTGLIALAFTVSSLGDPAFYDSSISCISRSVCSR